METHKDVGCKAGKEEIGQEGRGVPSCGGVPEAEKAPWIAAVAFRGASWLREQSWGRADYLREQ